MGRLAGTIITTTGGTTFQDPIVTVPVAGITSATAFGYHSVSGMVTARAAAISSMTGYGCLTLPTTGMARVAGTIFTADCGITILNAMSTLMGVDTIGMEVFGSIFLLHTVIPKAVGTFTMGCVGTCMGREFIPMVMVVAIFTMKEGGICTQGDTTHDIVQTDSFFSSIWATTIGETFRRGYTKNTSMMSGRQKTSIPARIP
jgi:hypothetical protein